MPAQPLPGPVPSGTKPNLFKSNFPIGRFEPLFAQSRQELSPKLSLALTSKAESILKTFGIKNTTKEQIDEITKEASRQTLENLAKIQNWSQADQVIIDSLAQSLTARANLWATKTQPPTEKIYQKVEKQIRNLSSSFQQDLEKTAVLGNLASIAKLKKPSQEIQSQVNGLIDQFVEGQYPLAPLQVNLTLKGNVAGFLQNYIISLEKFLATQISQNQMHTLDQLSQAKVATYNRSVSAIEVGMDKFKDRVNSQNLAERICYVLGLLPIPAEKEATLGFDLPQQKLMPTGLAGFFVRTALAPDNHQLETYYSLLAYNQERLEKTLKFYEKEPKKYQILANTQAFNLKNPTSVQKYNAIFQNLSGINSLNLASQFVWFATEAAFGKYPGIYVPQDHLIKDIFLAQKIIGGLING